MSKICRRCGDVKQDHEFSKNSKYSDGLQSYCKVCRAELARQGRKKIIRVHDGKKTCSRCGESKSVDDFYKSEKDKSGYISYCSQCSRDISAANRKTKRPVTVEGKTCKSCGETKVADKFSKSNACADGLHSYCKECRSKQNTEKHRQKISENVLYKITCSLRTRLNTAIRCGENAGKKGGSAVRDLGCSISDFMSYMESKFKPGMTWENWSVHGWHIDHIVPLSSFDLTDRLQLLKACHYSNLQPLWAKENLSKADKLAGT